MRPGPLTLRSSALSLETPRSPAGTSRAAASLPCSAAGQSKPEVRRVCGFFRSSRGIRTEYVLAAESVGQVLAGRGIGLVYGGGNIGLMGVVADSALAAGGEVIGVIPEALMARELGHAG